jgi:hypothetical protein
MSLKKIGQNLRLNLQKGKDSAEVFEYINAFDDLDADLLHDDNVRIIKAKKSGFQETIKKIQGTKTNLSICSFLPHQHQKS